MTIDISRYHKVLISTEACLFWDMKTKLKKQIHANAVNCHDQHALQLSI